MTENRFPPDWNEERIRAIIAHYDNQTEEEALAEDEAAYEHDDSVMMEVPKELVPIIRELIAKHQNA